MAVTRQEKFESFEKDEIYHLLSNHRRRHTIHYLKRNENPATLSNLAEQIAAWEQDKPINELDSDERKRVYTSLQQTHLPRLAQAGMIDYDDRTVSLTDEATQLEVYLDIVPEGSLPWSLYYLGLGIISSVVLLGVWVGVGPTAQVPGLAWAAAIVALFVVSALFHAVHDRRFRLGGSDPPP